MANNFTLPPGAAATASDHSINKRRTATVAALAALASMLPAAAQMTPAQRRADFEQIAAAVAKQYAPYAWKIQAFGYDALQLKPWLARLEKVRDDLEYYELCMEYVASLRDLHSGYFLQSDFTAELPFFVDLYDGKALIEAVDRSRLPASQYPIEPGDELISVDGVTPEEWIRYVSRLQSFANERATRRWAIEQIAYRQQSVLPRAHQIGETAEVVVRRSPMGPDRVFRVPWIKTGKPLERIGPVPDPVTGKAEGARMAEQAEPEERPAAERSIPALRRLPRAKRLRGFGRVTPVFALPDGFVTRVGRGSSDQIYSGWFEASGYRIGYLRLPQFPSSSFSRSLMLRQVESEVLWHRANTDGLIVDVMRNPGGDQCLTNEILRRLIPYPFRTTGDEIRPTLEIVGWFRQDVEDARNSGADWLTLFMLEAFLRDVETAYAEFRGITGPLPVCGLFLDLEPWRAADGTVLAYDKPLIVLVDDFSTSAADSFPAVLQDAGRALVAGMPTAGGGGLSLESPLGFYAEASVALSCSLGTRAREYRHPGLPPTAYLENAGVRPDVELDIMTRQNLVENGRPFVSQLVSIAVDYLRRQGASGRGLRAGE
ncbi:MAG: S41 family peptidase [Bryobacteraceae bacterium]|nr:S41 family peptidase [Bryobacteraceae bacterium]